MQNIKKQTTISSLDFNNLRKLMDVLINLKKIDDLDSLDADYSFEWQEDANEMIDGINKYVEQTLASLEAESYQNTHCSLTSLRIRLQNLNGTIDGITNDTILLHCDDKEFTWPPLNEDCRLLE
ncbi:hypothetical protein [Psychrobacter sp. SZ93C1]|uniref:hypothetical protein n=1 Tax=Psychrobacter sp. SZ93C1 TaxID=2792058 RepID=UPI0018CF0117|nr:hypothetical protein [Psychrobacter sp. SZ93C1]MBH0065193.1 hypothetical protein [Psychrobacter sp. SZ93C1]